LLIRQILLDQQQLILYAVSNTISIIEKAAEFAQNVVSQDNKPNKKPRL